MKKKLFLGRVVGRTARGISVEANPKYIRDVIAVLGLEESRPVSTPSVKRTPTTESLVELEKEKRAVYRTAVGKQLYMCQDRADIMYSVKETANTMLSPTGSNERCPECKVFDRDQHIPAVRERVHRQRLGKTTADVQELERWSYAVGSATLSAWSRTQQSVSLSSAEAELYALTTGISDVMVTKPLLEELRYEVTLVSHIDNLRRHGHPNEVWYG